MSMYERTYGYLYDRERSVKDDAKLIRSTIKTMAKAGILPADWTYSVRYDTFAGGCAIRVTATSPRPIYLMDPGMIAAHKERPRVVTVPRHLRDRADGGGEWMRLEIRAGDQYDIYWIDSLTDEARAVSDALNELHHACNHDDGSDSMTDHFDVKFYGTAQLETAPGVARSQRPRPEYLPVVTR